MKTFKLNNREKENNIISGSELISKKDNDILTKMNNDCAMIPMQEILKLKRSKKKEL